MIIECTKPCYNIKEVRGFSLIELMVALTISGVIAASIYAAYLSQQRTYLAQAQVAELQQNVRAAIFTMANDIRMAGYNPRIDRIAGVTVAGIGQMSFSMDLNGDGDILDPGEVVDIGFSDAAGSDANRDGIPDADADGDGNFDPLPLGRQVGGAGGYQAISENIERIEFLYFNVNGAQTADLGGITSVTISILSRTARPDRDYLNNTAYAAASGAVWGPFGDNFRRRLLTTRIECRNLKGNL